MVGQGPGEGVEGIGAFQDVLLHGLQLSDEY